MLHRNIDRMCPLKRHPFNDSLLFWLMGFDGFAMGSRWYDLTGGYYGNCVDCIFDKSEINQYKLRLDGSGDYVNMGPIFDSLLTNFTVIASARVNALSTFQNVIFKGSSQGQFGIFIGFPGGTNWLIQANGNVYGNTTLSANVIYRFAYTIHPTVGISLYLNGVSDNTPGGATSTATLGTDLTIGADAVNGRYVNGDIFDVQFHSKALSANEIMVEYLDYLSGFPDRLNFLPEPSKNFVTSSGVGLIGSGLINNNPLIRSNF